MKKHMQSSLFGRWIKAKRLELDLSQQEVADKVGKLTQADISVIERTGAMPRMVVLRELFQVLGLSMEELQRVQTTESLTSFQVTLLSQSQEGFKGRIAGLSQPSALYILRDSLQTFDRFRAELYQEILMACSGLTINILYRFNDPQFISSHRRFVGGMESHLQGNVGSNRIRGFVRSSGNELDMMPMIQPLALFTGGYELSGLTWQFFPEVERELLAAGAGQHDAQRGSLLLNMHHDSRTVDSLAHWIQFTNPLQLEPSRWSEITPSL